MRPALICVDFQKDFTDPSGAYYTPKASIGFVKEKIIPFLRSREIKTAEIISDYRQPRPGDPRDFCKPGTPGYESEIPPDIKLEKLWIKSMFSPIWVRENRGNPDGKPGLPYQDPEGFNSWLASTIGTPQESPKIILFGLTIDCCVFCVAQELAFRGYEVKILTEGTDTRSGSRDEKNHILNNPPLKYWASSISWEDFQKFWDGQGIPKQV